ncbi:MAG: RIP metalloprotease RseP [Candidatus Tectimicrobiota bacterium]
MDPYIIIAAIVGLGLLIFVHELGHFLVAKYTGVGVERFSIGFGPRLLGRTYGETEYRLSAIPLGGYVKLIGEDPGDASALVPNSYAAQSVGVRLAIVGAGPAFNVLMAVLIYALIYMIGVPRIPAVVGEVLPDTPAMRAGLAQGDTILSINGRPIKLWHDLKKVVVKSAGQKLTVVVERGGRHVTLLVIPELAQDKNIFGEAIQEGRLGIRASDDRVYKSYPPHVALWKGTVRTVDLTRLTILAVVKLIQGTVPAKSIGGPIMILQMAGEQARVGFFSYVSFIALLSINLAILNLLPIPILDGGHIFFLLAEAVMRRPVSLKWRETAQQVGLVLIISLMLFAILNDLTRIVTR